jgi:hypothetical protein
MKGREVVSVLLVCAGVFCWLQYRKCMPLPGATSVTAYLLSPLPADSSPAAVPRGVEIYRLPKERTFAWAAKIDRKIVLGRNAADRLNGLLSSPLSYRDNNICTKLDFNARYAFVMSKGNQRVEVVLDRYCFEKVIRRISSEQEVKTNILFVRKDWVDFVKRAFPDDPDLKGHE